jgi:hypothetical protein
MQIIHPKARRPNSVRAIFEDGMSTVLLSCDATFEELAGLLGRLTEQHRGRPIAFDVKLASLSH